MTALVLALALAFGGFTAARVQRQQVAYAWARA
jgi:hypothetical protein